MLSPKSPDMGRKMTSFFGLYPQPLRKGERPVTISSYLAYTKLRIGYACLADPMQ